VSIQYVLRKFVIWADGFGKLGEGENCKLPVMEINSEEFRGGGMDTPIKIDLGTNALTMEFKLSAFDPQVYNLWGLYPGQERQYTLRGSLAHHDGTPFAAIAACRGNLHKVESDALEPAKKILHTFTTELTYYKLTIGESLIYEIDIINGRRIINGVDQLRTDRIALGLAI
jgi:P2 family phage contractile tail tube protein